ncbi:hypothetical protein GCM10010211_26970 [Streptomyces albospinus]|uniref:Uncharacterized protein n=1 Tax=Streptomyces albospinus TaxID=285515 RepID=A0ABQ2UYR1_9ACTN|nr:hypothetical protein GCM10010211_26970 [Streptomyces albospinus]
MSPAAQQTVAVTVVGGLAVLGLITFFSELNSSENDANFFGMAACVAGVILHALGWRERRDRQVRQRSRVPRPV